MNGPSTADDNDQLREMTESDQWQDWLARDAEYLLWLDRVDFSLGERDE